jgi:hypothetical protein
VDIGSCSGSCSTSGMSITGELPKTLTDFDNIVNLHAECKCCQGTLESQDVALVCDGEVNVVRMPRLTNCQCNACGDQDYQLQLPASQQPQQPFLQPSF